jgi:hypothetical protein
MFYITTDTTKPFDDDALHLWLAEPTENVERELEYAMRCNGYCGGDDYFG